MHMLHRELGRALFTSAPDVSRQGYGFYIAAATHGSSLPIVQAQRRPNAKPEAEDFGMRGASLHKPATQRRTAALRRIPAFPSQKLTIFALFAAIDHAFRPILLKTKTEADDHACGFCQIERVFEIHPAKLLRPRPSLRALLHPAPRSRRRSPPRPPP